PSARLTAGSQVRAPALSDDEVTLPDSGVMLEQSASRAGELLAAAGYTRRGGVWRRDGERLSLVIATPGDRQPYARVAEALAGQLGSEGIDVRTEHVKPRGLFSGPLQVPTGDESEHDRTAETATTGEDPEAEQSDGSSVGTTVDIAVVPQESGPDAATVLASRIGCGAGSDTPATVRTSAA